MITIFRRYVYHNYHDFDNCEAKKVVSNMEQRLRGSLCNMGLSLDEQSLHSMVRTRGF